MQRLIQVSLSADTAFKFARYLKYTAFLVTSLILSLFSLGYDDITFIKMFMFFMVGFSLGLVVSSYYSFKHNYLDEKEGETLAELESLVRKP